MPSLRHALAAAAVLGVMLAPAASAGATADVDEFVSQLATDAADNIAEEQQLLEQTAAGNTLTPAEHAAVTRRLTDVDARGAEMLRQLDRLGLDLTAAVRTTLDRLPPADLPRPGQADQDGQPAPPPRPVLGIPPAVVYEAAYDDLMRIAETPPQTDNDSNQSIGLLAVAAAALVALGLAALSNTVRRSSDDELEQMAWSDGLTGVGNRRRLDRDLAKHHQTHSGPTAVIMIDIDHFKQVNEMHGHLVGDDILREFGRVLAASVRREDVVYRYGGEEFCVLLPSAKRIDAQAVAERIVTSARAITLPDGRNLTVSVGLAEGPANHVAETLATADRALFAAKSDGRDRTSSAPDSDEHLQRA